MRLLLGLFLLSSFRCLGAFADPLSAYVETNGRVVHIKISGMATNGTYNTGLIGFPSNNIVALSNKCILTLKSCGFNDDCTTNINQRQVIGITRYPFPYPDTNRFEYLEGNDVWLQVSLSDFIYSQDSAITLDLASGFYVNGTTNSAATVAMTVTNLSTNTYQRVIGNNSRFDSAFAYCTNGTQRVAVLAYHWSGQSGRPVRAIKFYATNDTSSVSVTQVVNQATYDPSYGDLTPVCEYIWDVPLATLGSSNKVTVLWQAYPWIGDTNSVLATDDGVTNKFTMQQWSPLTFFNDRSLQLHQTWANVDPTNGSDATGIAVAASSWTSNTTPYRTIRGAAKGICDTNNLLWVRNDLTGSYIWLSAGDHVWSGTNFTIGNRQSSWVTVTKMPYAQRSGVIITTNNSTSSPLQDLGDVVKVQDVTIGYSGNTAAGSIFDGIDYLTMNDCDINSGQGAAFNFNTNWCFIRCPLIYLKQKWLAPQAPAPSSPIFRGCSFINTNSDVMESCFIVGCKKTNNTILQLRASTTKLMQPFIIWAFNKFLLSNAVAADSINLERRENDVAYAGAVLAQVEMECVANPAANGLISIGSSGTTSNYWNCLIVDCTLPGNKVNWFYNEVTPLKPHLYNHVIGTFIDDHNIKSDEFATADGTKIGNHACLFGVGWAYNILPETGVVGAAGTFPHRYGGIGVNSYVTVGTNSSGLAQFFNRQAYENASTPGGGDYRLKSTSPLFNLPGHWFHPIDIDGHSRSAVDPPGAHASGNLKHGISF